VDAVLVQAWKQLAESGGSVIDVELVDYASAFAVLVVLPTGEEKPVRVAPVHRVVSRVRVGLTGRCDHRVDDVA
jgi:hypothetical protein